jgi:thioredoxin-dependent peroxiredoxin
MPMPRPLAALVLLTSALAALPAAAALKPGDTAPDFTLPAAIGGQPFSFRLADALKKGPVVLYFYPKSFTAGCTLEAHLFAEATPKFEQLGATVIGVSRDDLATQQKFSKSECRDRFAVAADEKSAVIKSYDVEMTIVPGMANRVSYVIGRDGKVAAVHASGDPEGHVGATMKAVQTLTAVAK